MKPILYCVLISYADGVAYSDIDYIRELILSKSKNGSIQYLDNECFVFRSKDYIKETLEKVYREFGHAKELITEVSLLHILDIETLNMEFVFDKNILH
jgi:uncharacterized membrane protein YgaE (UPF0421/DUF939 family)